MNLIDFVMHWLAPMDYYYIVYLIVGSTVSGCFGLLRGQGPSNPMFLKFVRSCLFLMYWYPVFRFSFWSGILLLAYYPSFIDLSELSLTRVSGYMRSCVIVDWLKAWLGATLIKTTDIEQKCIIAMHPHGLLPIGAGLNITTSASDFEGKFPKLSNRAFVCASIVTLAPPPLRDAFLSIGCADVSKYSFENFLVKGHTVCVFVGGAIEAMYSNPDREQLDLRRKKGFLRMSIRHGVPVVPCYTFNEVDYAFQISDEFWNKFPFLGMVRYMYNRLSGIILVCAVVNPFPLMANVTTVMGKPMSFGPQREPTEEELETAMDQYIVVLTKLYDTYAPVYNSNKNRKLVIKT